jgi:hypothetical protein
MSIVSKETLIFNGQRIKKVVRVNKDGLFKIAYPSEVVELLGDPNDAVAKTKDEAERKWENRLKEFAEAMTETRKVIVYRILIQSIIQGGDTSLRREDISFGHGIGVLLWADVFEETHVINTDGTGRYNYKRIKDTTLPSSVRNGGRFPPRVGETGKRESRIMDWTPEREEFFCHVANLLERLSIKLAAISKDNNAFAALAQEALGSLLTDGKL